MSKYASLIVTTLTFTSLLPSMVSAQSSSPRQYYGAWQKHPSGYAYRPYYYKPTPTYSGYKHHYVIHHPKRPQYQYYYNPYSKKYWGRCPTQAYGKPAYSLLKEGDRSTNLAEISESAFPPPGPMPGIPESQDGAAVDLPPDDLPDLSSLPD